MIVGDDAVVQLYDPILSRPRILTSLPAPVIVGIVKVWRAVGRRPSMISRSGGRGVDGAELEKRPRLLAEDPYIVGIWGGRECTIKTGALYP
jgi:hypothetical protein